MKRNAFTIFAASVLLSARIACGGEITIINASSESPNPPAPAPESGGELLDEVITKPGNWNQMCSTPPPVPSDVPLPLYSRLATRYFTVSESNRARLRGRRDEVVPEIVRRLHQFEFSTTNSETQKQVAPGFQSGQSPSELSGLMLEIIEDLDATETLPELMRLEDDLNTRLSLAEVGDVFTLPMINLDSPSSMNIAASTSATNASPESIQNNIKLFGWRVIQREILSTMATLLRHKSFPSMLKSDYEAQYHSYLEHEAENDAALANVRTAADIRPGEETWIWIDPVYKLPARNNPTRNATIPYSAAMRSQIREIVAQFLKENTEKPSNGSAAVK